jgi:hypothetical protein
MVNATPFNPKDPEFTRDVFLKCVLGSIDPYYDDLLKQPVNSPAPKLPPRLRQLDLLNPVAPFMN